MRMIIVGCGAIGSGLAQLLSKEGHSVSVIDKDPCALRALGPSFVGQRICGVGFDKDVLAEAHVEMADALAAFTSSDESNAVIARMARENYRVPKVVARLYDPNKAEIYKRLGVETLASTTWAIQRASDLLKYSPLNSVFNFGSGDLDLVEVEAPLLLVDHKVEELVSLGETQVVAIRRDNKMFLPTWGTILNRGDVLYIAATAASSDVLRKMLGLDIQGGM